MDKKISLPMSEERLKEKLAKARERYGKPFAHEVKVKRQTDPSYILQHLNQLSNDVPTMKENNVSYKLREKQK